MRKFLLFLIFSGVAGVLPVHAFNLNEESGFPPVQAYPYPPVLSPAIENLPQGFNTIILGDETFYYYKGNFYQKIIRDSKYAMVSAPIGAVVFNLPQGYQYMDIYGRAFYVFNGVYYKKVLDGYEVIFPPPGV